MITTSTHVGPHLAPRIILHELQDAQRQIDALKAEFDDAERQRVIDHPWIVGFLPLMPMLPPITQAPKPNR